MKLPEAESDDIHFQTLFFQTYEDNKSSQPVDTSDLVSLFTLEDTVGYFHPLTFVASSQNTFYSLYTEPRNVDETVVIAGMFHGMRRGRSLHDSGLLGPVYMIRFSGKTCLKMSVYMRTAF